MYTQWNDAEILKLKLTFATTDKIELEQMFNRSYESIRKKASTLTLKRIIRNRLTKNTAKFLIDINKYKNMYYSGKSINKISKETGYCHATIRKVFKLNNVIKKDKSSAHRKYQFNINYFDNIDTEEKAYFLGFIYADGFITLKNNNYLLGIEIHQNDIEILNKFKKSIEAESPLKFYNRVDRTSVRIRLYNKHLIETLIKCGVVPQKSLILEFPTNIIIPDNLLHHFMRGYFDGDGCVTRSKNNTRHVSTSITSSNNFIDSYMYNLHKLAGLNLVKIRRKSKFSILTYCGKGNALKIFKYLYKDATIFLKRKYDKFNLFLLIES